MNMIIPIIRRMAPAVLAEQLVSVQPMTGAGGIFELRHVTQQSLPEPLQGNRRHSFLKGWQRYYGNQWIAESVWIKIKIKGL